MRRQTQVALLTLTLALALTLAACQNNHSPVYGFRGYEIDYNGPRLPDIDVSASADGVVPLPQEVDPIFGIFDRYAQVVAPNGRPIHLLAEPGYTDAQMIYARGVLESHLTDVPESLYGDDKSAIANAMADNHAILALFASTESMRSDAGRRFFESGVNSQDLRGYETIVEGTPEAMSDDPTRDAGYEEILHFVQDYGINYAAPELDTALGDAFAAALESGTYAGDDSETNEYFVVAMEAYFDLWRHDPGGDGTVAGGEYQCISREQLRSCDPAAFAIIQGFFGDTWQYTAAIDPGFEGSFALAYDEAAVYTNRSQHLTRATLTGTNNSSLSGNDHANVLAGNTGNNVLAGHAGNDVLRGREGTDTAVFAGARDEYEVLYADEALLVTDTVAGRDGKDSLEGIEILRFADEEMPLADGGAAFQIKPFALIETGDQVTTPPAGVPGFYRKYLNADGIVIVSSAQVPDAALVAARATIMQLLSTRPDVHRAMLLQHPRISIMAVDETASDLPEYGPGADGQWGLGQMPGAPTSLVSERGICYAGNAAYRANFLLHEFVHAMQNLGWAVTDPESEDEIYAAYIAAVGRGEFAAPVDEPLGISPAQAYGDDEYLTHSINAWFDLDESLPGPWVDVQIGDSGPRSGTRAGLLERDPELVAIIARFLPDSLENLMEGCSGQ